MEKIKYAPVLIPTLNRFEHFKKCIESLECCSLSEKTDVYVGLDYPPSPKYESGWIKNREFLLEKQLNNKFHKLIIFFRNSNCGVSGPNGNLQLLINEIKDNYDYYIVTEDDNVFSPCFLDYMNKVLHCYENDPNITSVAGYNHNRVEKYSDFEIIATKDNTAWGMGRWSRKESEYPFGSIDYACRVYKSTSKSLKVLINYPICFITLCGMIKNKVNYGDTNRTIYNILNNKYQLRPNLSLVKNCGHDGSGINCTVYDAEYENESINDSTQFLQPVLNQYRLVPKKFMFFSGMKHKYYAPVFLIWGIFNILTKR